MKTASLFAAVLTVALSSPALAAEKDPIRIGAGKEGGGYDAAARTICDGLVKNSIPCVVVNYDGSEDITNAVTAGNIDFGIAQSDSPFLLNVNPTRTTKLFEEVGLLACAERFDMSELHDLDDDSVVVVGPIGSGGALSWDGMIRSEREGSSSPSDWINATPEYVDLEDGLLMVEDGEAHCIFAVARPNSKTFESWSNGGLVFADLDDGDLDDLERNEEPVYPSDDREIHGTDVEVIILSASLYRNAAVDSKAPEALKLVRRLARSVR